MRIRGVRRAGALAAAVALSVAVTPQATGLTFSSSLVHSSPSAQPFGLVTADVNRDGIPDLVTVNRAPASELQVWTGTGTGAFTGPSVVSDDDTPFAAEAADLDGDGKLDLVTANRDDATIGLFQGAGDGTFTSFGSTGGYTGHPADVAVGDVNLDGHADLVTVNQTEETLTVLTGDSTGDFTPDDTLQNLGTQPMALAIGDLDGDGDLDAVTADSADSPLTGNGFTVWAGDGSSDLQMELQLTDIGIGPQDVLLADFDRDGDLDIALVTTGENRVHFLRNNGGMSFSESWSDSMTQGQAPVSMTAADLDRDGDVDLAVANLTSHGIGLLRNDGNGGFDFFESGAFTLPDSYPSAVVSADLDRDGLPDLAMAASGPLGFYSIINTTDEDSIVPNSLVRDGPDGGTTTDRSPTFRFESGEPDVSFTCQIDSGSLVACASPFTTPNLDDGAHTFKVSAMDGHGNTGPVTTRMFTVDATPPTVNVTGPTKTKSARPTFTFTSSATPQTFECALDGGRSYPCTSPYQTPKLSPGEHLIEVFGIDEFGNHAVAIGHDFRVVKK